MFYAIPLFAEINVAIEYNGKISVISNTNTPLIGVVGNEYNVGLFDTKQNIDKSVKRITLFPMSEDIIRLLQSIPYGKVATYGQIARLAGYPNAARQVVRILHTCSGKYQLPWHRVINAKGQIALSEYSGADEQRDLLESEGIEFRADGTVNLHIWQWDGSL